MSFQKNRVFLRGTTLNPSTFGGMLENSPQNNGVFEMFWSCLGPLNDRCWNVIYEKRGENDEENLLHCKYEKRQKLKYRTCDPYP